MSHRRHVLSRLSISRKLTLLMMATALVALLAASAIFGAYDYFASQRVLVAKVTAISDIVGGNSAAAITFDDHKAAAAILLTLRDQSAITAATLVDATGNTVAAFDRLNGGRVVPCLAAAGVVMGDHALVVSRPIVYAGETIGTACVESDFSELTARGRRYSQVFVVAMIVSLVAAVVFSHSTQRLLTDPVLQLAAAARAVSTAGASTVRAPSVPTMDRAPGGRFQRHARSAG